MNDLAEIGPVQLLQVAFDAGAYFEGHITDELARPEKKRTIRVLDLVRREGHRLRRARGARAPGGEDGTIVGALPGLEAR